MGDMAELYDYILDDEEDSGEDGVWCCKDGSRILIEDMTDEHILNALRQQKRRGLWLNSGLVQEAINRDLDLSTLNRPYLPLRPG